jgi:hypothetical protein
MPHSCFGDDDRCGCLEGFIRGDEADIVCNECGGLMLTVPTVDLERTLTEMELTLDICSELCPHCGKANGISGFRKSWRTRAASAEKSSDCPMIPMSSGCSGRNRVGDRPLRAQSITQSVMLRAAAGTNKGRRSAHRSARRLFATPPAACHLALSVQQVSARRAGCAAKNFSGTRHGYSVRRPGRDGHYAMLGPLWAERDRLAVISRVVRRRGATRPQLAPMPSRLIPLRR